MDMGSGIKPIPDPGVKKAPDPGSGSATLSAMVFVLISSVSSQQCWQSSSRAGRRWRRRTTRGCRSCSSSCSTTCPATWRQGCGSAFISSGSGSGSSILGWIPIRIRIQSGSRALMSKNWQKITAEKNYIFLGSKTTIYLSLGLHKERPSYRRSLQLSKEAIQHFRTWTVKKFSTFEGHFCSPGSGSGFRIQSGYGSGSWSATLREGAAQDGGAAHHPAPPGQFRRSHITHHQADAQVVTLMPDPEQVFRPVSVNIWPQAISPEIREC